MDKRYWFKKHWYGVNKGKVTARRRQALLAGKWKGLHKRPYTNACELCGSELTRLGYHHWDDNEPSLGIWLCAGCHKYAEGFDKALGDKPLLEVYAKLKDTVTSKYYQTRLL